LLGWTDTFVAACIALPQLEADTFVCMDPALGRAVANTATVASIEDLLGSRAVPTGRRPSRQLEAGTSRTMMLFYYCKTLR
jgi:hypothetical protein